MKLFRSTRTRFFGKKAIDPFHYEIWSDQDHESLTAEIYCGENPATDCVGLVTASGSGTGLVLELFPRKDGKPWVLPLDSFLGIIAQASAGLERNEEMST